MKVSSYKKRSSTQRPIFVTEKGFVIRRTAFGEADWILQVLLPAGALLPLHVAGGRKSSKRFGGGVLEPTHFLEIEYRASSGEGRMASLTGARLLQSFSGIRKSFEALDSALAMLAQVGRVAQEGNADSEDLFHLVGNSLMGLHQLPMPHSSSRILTLRTQFSLRLLHNQGVLSVEDWMLPFLQHSSASLPESVMANQTQWEYTANLVENFAG